MRYAISASIASLRECKPSKAIALRLISLSEESKNESMLYKQCHNLGRIIPTSADVNMRSMCPFVRPFSPSDSTLKVYVSIECMQLLKLEFVNWVKLSSPQCPLDKKCSWKAQFSFFISLLIWIFNFRFSMNYRSLTKLCKDFSALTSESFLFWDFTDHSSLQ